MEISLTSTSLTDIKTECLVVGVPEGDSVEGTSTELDTLISDLIDSGDFKARSGSQMTLRNPQGISAKRLVLFRGWQSRLLRCVGTKRCLCWTR